MRLARRLPSFTIVLAAISLSLLIPLSMFGYVRWEEADARYRSAISMQERAERLQLLLQLTPALSQEEFSSVWAGSGQGLLDDLPATASLELFPNYGATSTIDRERVDALVGELGDSGLEEALAVLRADIEAGDVGLFDYGNRYGAVIEQVESALDDELRFLSADAAQAGAGELVQTVRVAETTASLQVVAAGLETSWARMASAEILPLVLQDSVDFAESVAVFEQRIGDLERVASTDSEVGAGWSELQSSQSVRQLRARYHAVVRSFAASGVDPTAVRSSQIQSDEVDLVQLLRAASELKIGLDQADAFNRGLAEVVEVSLEEVDVAAAELVVDAQTDRRRIIGLTVLFMAQITGAAFALVLTVGRPIQRMADAARRLSLGQLDTQLDETGPTEVRMGARALNEATASLRIAESQAVALAEERLDDKVLGERAPGELGKSLQAAVDRLAVSLSDRDSFQRQLEHDAAHDHLTRLSNRAAILRHLNAALARTRRHRQAIALLFLDIDDFKGINDTHGHHTGDLVLQTIAERLLLAIRTGDLAGRLGGDEFVVVAEPVGDLDAALALSKRILAEVSKPITVEGVTFHPSVSIGVGISDGMSELSADELLRDADSAVYRAKSHGKGRVEVCDENLRSALRERDLLEQSIREAIDHDELRLFFQPSVSADDRSIVGVEALVRWERPGVGLVSPDAFIPAAERTDLILDIDRWVLGAAMGQLARWSSDPTLRSVSVAVNISGRHLGSGTLLYDVESAIKRHNIDPTNLVLEVTETALLEDITHAARELSVLQRLGVKIALDDFGTGFMSLAHLRLLPVDILKIDRSFVSEIESHADHSLVQLIVDTGHLLGVTITGEGVETETQAQVLSSMDVDHLQGYYFSRPVPAREIVTLALAERAGSNTAAA